MFRQKIKKNNPSTVLKAVQRHPSKFKDASSDLQKDRSFVLEAVKKNGKVLKYAPSKLKADRGVVLEAVNQDGFALNYASSELKKDREIVLAAVKENIHALKYASDSLRGDQNFVLKVVNQNGFALDYAASKLKKDREIVLAAVKQSGIALDYAASKLKKDREIVLAAVKQSGWALKYASSELKKDREVVLEAVKQSGWALDYASSELKAELQADRDIVIIAIISSRYIPSGCSEVLKNDLSLKLLGDVLSSYDLKCLVDFSKKSKDNYELVLKMLREVGELLKKEYGIDSYENTSALDFNVKYIFKISQPCNISLIFDLDTPGYRDEEDWFTYGDENQDKPTVTSDIFDSYSSLMTCMEKVQHTQEEFIKILNATCVQSDISLLTRLFRGNKIFKKFMDEKELWKEIDHKYASLIKDLSSSDRSVLVDWRIVHLFHVFGGIEGTEGVEHQITHTQSLINCLNETGNGDIAEKFSTDCFDTGYIGHYFCLMVTSGSEGNKTIKNLDELKVGDTITLLDRGGRIFEVDYCQVSYTKVDYFQVSYTVEASVEKLKSFFKSCKGKEGNSVKKELQALVDSKALNKSELGGFRYGGKNMKKGICSMNQKLWIREALTLKHGLKKGFKKYKEFSTIYRMREFEKFYLQSDASLFLEDEIAMVKNIIGRIEKGHITEASITSSESISPIMKGLWKSQIKRYCPSYIVIQMIRCIKNKGANMTLETVNQVALEAVMQSPLAFQYVSEEVMRYLVDKSNDKNRYELREQILFFLTDKSVSVTKQKLLAQLCIDMIPKCWFRSRVFLSTSSKQILNEADKLVAIDEKKEPFERGVKRR